MTKSGFRLLIWMLPALVVTAACSTDTAEGPIPQLEGPALIMFYTDG